MDSPAKRRGALKAKLTRLETFVNDLKYADETTPVTKVDIIQLRKRLADTATLLTRFEEVQLEVEATCENLDSEYLVMETFESNYYKVTSSAEELIQKFAVDEGRLENLNLNPNDDGSHQARSIAESISGSRKFVKLPTINLPNFNGKPEQWLNFRDLFSSLIHTNEDLTAVHKLHYLRASLTGKASEAVNGLAMSSANYKIAWDSLNDRYNNSRSLIYYHIKELFNLECVPKESSNKLRNVIDALKRNMRSLNSLMDEDKQREAFLIYLLQSKLDATTNREFENQTGSSVSTLEELIKFVEKKASLMETVEERSHKSNIISSSKSLHASTQVSCNFCKGSHLIYNCDTFKSLSVIERMSKVKENGLCVNCLAKGHNLKNCKSSYKCRTCNSKHNTLLHIVKNNSSERSSLATPQADQTFQNPEISLSSFVSNHSNVLLSTAVVNVSDSHGKIHRARILLDSGSQSCFVTERFVKGLGLKTSDVNINVMGFAKSVSKVIIQCSVKLMAVHSSFEVDVSCLMIPIITGSIPGVHVDISHLNIPSNIRLADPEFEKPGEIDILVGASCFYNLLCVGQISLGRNQPILQKTRFGWVVSGNVGSPSFHTREVNCNFASCIPNVQDQLARFWELEEIPSSKPMSVEENECEMNFAANTVRDDDGRFVVKIPLKEPLTKLGTSYDQAKKRLFSLEKRLTNDKNLRNRYSAFMREYAELGHMSPAEGNVETSYFLPHHGVIREDKVSTKLRVVFNGSAPTSTGYTLNDLQMVGPVLQRDLFSILLDFRSYTYVFSADIEKMYRQVMICPNQRHLQMILWREDPKKEIQMYELNTVTYGTAAASFLAIRSLHQLGIECSNSHPAVSKIILNNFYVDDVLAGTNSLEEAQEICTGLCQVLDSGCFPLRKWVSNDPRVLKNINPEHLHPQLLKLGSEECTKTLGISWFFERDDLVYSISKSDYGKVTKRTILSEASQIFDPLGLLAPSTVVAKMLLQQLWLRRLDWDESVPLDLYQRWVDFRSKLVDLNSLKIPRHVVGVNPKVVELHGFCDASTLAYGGCVYVRSISDDNSVCCRLLCAKGKVAPLKTTKCYVCLFVCFTTKAVHIELVSELTSSSFLLALKRFASRRGKPSKVYSDNSTTYVGANSKLIDLQKFIQCNQKELSDSALDFGIDWHFIPPQSPHFGGLWEAGIKSVKHHLKRVTGTALLTFEELYTLLTQIEAILNSRPLSPLSSDANDLSPLTPAHFLIGRPLTAIPEIGVTSIAENRLQCLERVQQIQQHFWKRWNLEYISELQKRTKWQNTCGDLNLGRLVIVKEDGLPPLRWRLGRVIRLHPGKDGINRVATLKISSGTIKRSFSKLCPLPLQ